MGLQLLPHLLSLSRIVLALLLYFYSTWILSSWLFVAAIVFAAISDGLDGFMARWLKCESDLGSYLDPCADAGFIVIACSACWQAGLMPTWLMVALLLRYSIIGALHLHLRLLGVRQLGALASGKYCMAWFFIYLFLLAWHSAQLPFGQSQWTQLSLWVLLLLLLLSAVDYIHRYGCLYRELAASDAK